MKNPKYAPSCTFSKRIFRVQTCKARNFFDVHRTFFFISWFLHDANLRKSKFCQSAVFQGHLQISQGVFSLAVAQGKTIVLIKKLL